jgi:Flp pilus assembly protein TadG
VSSTTSRAAERGQVLIVFALSATVIMLLAALAFDVGTVLVEKRDQQDAADAAALAGARFLPGNPGQAQTRAIAIAAANGYVDGVGSVEVVVNIPPTSGDFTGFGSGAIEVNIGNARSSVFAGVIGRGSWDVGSRSVAVNQTSSSGPFAMLALSPTACPGLRVEGTGVITSRGNIQVNSGCVSGDRAFRVAGSGSLDLDGPGIGCNIVGGATFGGGVSHNDCNPANTGSLSVPDPFDAPPRDVPLGDPPVPPPPAAIVAESGHAIPASCPGGSNPATDASPSKCNFGGSYDSHKTWRLFPGYYPGGINLQGGNFLLEPGVYYVADGGFRVANAAVRSVASGGSSLDGGVLIFNTTHPSSAVSPGPIVLQGGSAEVQLRPLAGSGPYAPYDKMVIYQDRDLSLTVEIHGGGSNSQVRGIVYAPRAHVFARGNAGTLTLDQIIAWTFEVRGNGGTINVAYDEDFLPLNRYAGLVE